MDKSTIDQFLYVVFGPSTQQVFHGWPILPFTFDWSDDIDEQARIIRKLANIATPKGGEVFGFEAQTWAYDKLREIVRDYREHSTLGSVPPEMIAWCFDVASGAIEPLKRRRGRVRLTNMARNKVIIHVYAWLRDIGYTKESAMETIAKAVERVRNEKKSRKKRVSFGPDAVDQILDDGDPIATHIEKYEKEIDAFLSL